MINWNILTEDRETIGKICKRVKSKYPTTDLLSLDMDLTTTHANGCPLDLNKLLTFPDFDFYHDIFGIITFINRKNGKLTSCFLPRCAEGK